LLLRLFLVLSGNGVDSDQVAMLEHENITTYVSRQSKVWTK